MSIGFYACPYVYSLYPECFITPLKIPLYTSVEQLASSVSLLELLKWDHSFGQVNANEDGLSLDLKLNCQFRINLIITRIAKHFKQCLVQRSKKGFAWMILGTADVAYERRNGSVLILEGHICD